MFHAPVESQWNLTAVYISVCTMLNDLTVHITLSIQRGGVMTQATLTASLPTPRLDPNFIHHLS